MRIFSTSTHSVVAIAAIAAIAVGVLSLAGGQVQSYTGVLTWHNDNQRTGQYLGETVLTPANVNKKQFGKLFAYPVDGQIYAQPLYVNNVSVPGQGVHNAVYVATENDSVYAFDADGLSAAPLWQDSFINPDNGITAVPCADTGACSALSPTMGITGTPVIDGTSGTLYVVAFTAENGDHVQRLHALDITTGAEKFGGPVEIQASVAGTGGGSSGGVIKFDPINESQRTALLLSKGVVYMGWGTFANPPWHGWIMGYNAKTLKRVAVFMDTPNGVKGGIWGSGAGLAADGAGSLYVVTGDGTFDADTGGLDYGDSVLRLSPSAGGLSVPDYFTPFNQDYLNNNDLDIAAGGAVLLPPQPGSYPREMVAGGKEGVVYVINRDSLGGYTSTVNNIIQTVTTGGGGFWSTPAYFHNSLYISPTGGALGRYTLTNGLLSTTPVSQSPILFKYPGVTPSVSANGTKNGIVWAIARVKNSPAVLHAFLASNLANHLYGSSQAGNRDIAGTSNKFVVPTVINGKVYVGTQTELDVYGLLPQ